jgi:hypothetical protein
MITIDLIGRLGNQMFQYAVCRTVAERNGYKFYIPQDKNNHGQNISNYFSIDMGINVGNIQHRFGEDHTKQQFNPQIFNIPDNTSIWGFYQTDKYFISNQENVKNWFKIEMNDSTKAILDKYPTSEYCYIHFRGTDYRNWDSGTRFLPKKYFEDAMAAVTSINVNIKFIVVTDDIDGGKEYFPGCEIISNDMMVDFSLLYYSKYCIITNSTFSWWAAWLSDKDITVAPNNWLNYQMPHLGFYPVDIRVEKFKYV